MAVLNEEQAKAKFPVLNKIKGGVSDFLGDVISDSLEDVEFNIKTDNQVRADSSVFKLVALIAVVAVVGVVIVKKF